MDLFGIVTLLGGLALFFYGMNLMAEGLRKLSGGRLEEMLGKLTSGSLRAVLFGAGATAVMQSSSAVTVMVVGFVDAEVMQLEQSAGVIMGANIGTTITSWLLSTTGIRGGTVWLRLFEPSFLLPIMAMTGMFFCLLKKNEKQKTIGNLFMGIAVILFGMEKMRDAVAPLSAVPEFKGLMVRFTNPLHGLLTGAVLTAVIQSSSASVGILQALCTTGAVPYNVAVPIIMGQNIGTCITAILASLSASKNAKRAACIHLYFNLIGTTVFMTVFYTLHSLFRFGFMQRAASEAGIAVIHTILNITAAFVLLPFSKYLVLLAKKTIPDHSYRKMRKNGGKEKL